ncbi:MAG: Growth inhibitor toxin [Candidatus Tokpelaia sp. JSC189]|nr:MAG: Growth inhibitor toxin [Candidatus Tokpelaia sp. JSC189]
MWLNLDPTKGREQRGQRPVLVVSPDAFNHATGLPVPFDCCDSASSRVWAEISDCSHCPA